MKLIFRNSIKTEELLLIDLKEYYFISFYSDNIGLALMLFYFLRKD